MLRKRQIVVAGGLLLIDLLLIATAFLLAYWIRNTALPRLGLTDGRLYPLSSYLPMLGLALPIAAVLLLSTRAYSQRMFGSLTRDAGRLVAVSVATGLLLVVFTWFFRPSPLSNEQLSRLWIGLFTLAICVLLILGRLLVRIVARIHHKTRTLRNVVVAGDDDEALRVADTVRRNAPWGIQLLGLVIPAGKAEEARRLGFEVLGTKEELPQIIEKRVVDDVIFSVPRRRLAEQEELFLILEEQGIRTHVVLDFFPHLHAKMDLGRLDDVPLVSFSTVRASGFRLSIKRLVDLVGASALLILLSPLMLVMAALIKLTSKGPVLFTQKRCGLNGRPFTMYKFRSMVVGAEARLESLDHLNEMDGPVFKLKEDPRVTPIGRLMRKSSLDELPQLWNVVRGEMSLVGPRPPVPAEVEQYARWQRRRLSMRPGLTCLWQISGRNQVDFKRWMELDLEYIDSWSLMLDLRILLLTLPAVVTGRGAS